jgi:hypothetical protein
LQKPQCIWSKHPPFYITLSVFLAKRVYQTVYLSKITVL